MSASDLARLTQLRERTRATLAEALAGHRTVALLDVPNQRNAGDSLIFAGELQYLTDLGVKIAYLADMESFDAQQLRRAMPSGLVLLHGGGNFGDIWFGHQAHRERIARALPDYPIVALPQSVYYNSAERAGVSNDVLGAHPAFRLLVRDEESLARARAVLPDVHSTHCPDLAPGWQPPRPARAPGDVPTVLILAREDREGASGLVEVPPGWLPGVDSRVLDWAPRGPQARSWAVARSTLRGLHRARDSARWGRVAPAAPRVVSGLLRHINAVNVRSATRLYDGVSLAVVDRLHAHVFAVLLGIPHIVLDNSYGKIGAVMSEYTGEFDTVRRAADLDEARSIAREMLESR